MLADLGAWVALAGFALGGAIAWGQHQQKLAGHGRGIKDLYEKKANGEDLRRLEAIVERLDRWERDHEAAANQYRLEAAERFASCEKSLEIGMNNHAEIVRLVGRLESAIDKMEKKFEGLTQKMEDAMQRRRGNDSHA